MNEVANQIISIVVGGAILALLTFIAALTWNIRKIWIQDHEWQKMAAKTLEDHRVKFDESNKTFESVMLKISGLDTRMAVVEHPRYFPVKRKNERRE